jgi:hypothetical protein
MNRLAHVFRDSGAGITITHDPNQQPDAFIGTGHRHSQHPEMKRKEQPE